MLILMDIEELMASAEMGLVEPAPAKAVRGGIRRDRSG